MWHDSIHIALDTYSEGDSQTVSVNVLGPGGGKVIVLLQVSEEAWVLRSDVTIILTLLYSAFCTPWLLHGVTQPASPGDKLQVSNFMLDKLPILVKEKKLRPMKVNLVIWLAGKTMQRKLYLGYQGRLQGFAYRIS